MTDPETRQMIEVLAGTLPDDILDATEGEIAQYLCKMCDIANYQVSAMNAHLFTIIATAKTRDRNVEGVF
jgi:hypothetical protein